MNNIYHLSDVIDDIQQLVNSLSTQKKVAELLDISPQYLTDILKGRRKPGPMVLRKLGFERVVGYRYIGKSAKVIIANMPIIHDQAVHEAMDDLP